MTLISKKKRNNRNMTIETKIRSEASSCEPVFAMFLQKVAILGKIVDSDGLGLKKASRNMAISLKMSGKSYHLPLSI